MKKLIAVTMVAFFAVSTGAFAAAHMKGDKDAPKAEKGDKKDDKGAKKDEKAKK